MHVVRVPLSCRLAKGAGHGEIMCLGLYVTWAFIKFLQRFWPVRGAKVFHAIGFIYTM